jgi:hypothetical protein
MRDRSNPYTSVTSGDSISQFRANPNLVSQKKDVQTIAWDRARDRAFILPSKFSAFSAPSLSTRLKKQAEA